MKFDYRTPSDVVRFIEGTPRLRDLANQEGWEVEAIFNEIIKIVPQDQLMPALRRMAIDAMRDAINRERLRVRQCVKNGKDTNSVFHGFVEREFDWAETLSKLDRESNVDLCERLQGVLSKWMMRNGKPLGECTANYLRKEAWREEQLADGHMKNASFYKAIASDLPDDAVVGKMVTSTEAEALRLRIFGDGVS